MMINGNWEVDRDDDDHDEADDDGDDDFYDDIELDIDINGLNPIDLLDDDHEIFNITDNEIILSDDDSDDNDIRIEVTDLPQAAQDYLTQNHNGVQVCYVEEEEDNDEIYDYEVELVDGTELYFDANGNLVDQDLDDDTGCDDDGNNIDRIVFTRVI
ncbi:MAG: PepSY-like domain-containing protein [Nonlabens sp.]|uniref:PepSY-like domain-containing protein n=1 Tax=Nonlabens sp. TaxID=1888209 RepID=UPI00321AFC2D